MNVLRPKEPCLAEAKDLNDDTTRNEEVKAIRPNICNRYAISHKWRDHHVGIVLAWIHRVVLDQQDANVWKSVLQEKLNEKKVADITASKWHKDGVDTQKFKLQAPAGAGPKINMAETLSKEKEKQSELKTKTKKQKQEELCELLGRGC